MYNRGVGLNFPNKVYSTHLESKNCYRKYLKMSYECFFDFGTCHFPSCLI